MSVLNFLKPVPAKEEIQDEKVVKKQYKYWRFRLFYTMYIGYAFYYFSRKSFTFAIPSMKEHLGMSLGEIGLLGSILSIVYGISKFVNGVIGDKSNPRYFMSVGLILTGVFNIFFGLSSSLIFFAIFWGLNGWFQGWGWPGCAKLLTHWYSQSERGKWWSIWSTAHNVGAFVIPLLVAFLLEKLGLEWRYALFVPGAICILAGLFIMNRLRDTPQSLGLPRIEEFRQDYPSKASRKKEKLQLSAKEILFNYVLTNRYIWFLAFSYFFVYVVRTAVNDWSLLYLVEQKGYSYMKAGWCISAFEGGGFLGILTAGWSSDKFFAGRRNPINAIFSLLVVLAILALWYLPGVNLIRDSLLMGSIGFFIFGPQMLIGMAAAELSHKKAAATATGFTGTFAYLGAAFAGAPLGLAMQKWGWDGFFMTMIVASLIATMLVLPMWSIKTNPKEVA